MIEVDYDLFIFLHKNNGQWHNIQVYSMAYAGSIRLYIYIYKWLSLYVIKQRQETGFIFNMLLSVETQTS